MIQSGNGFLGSLPKITKNIIVLNLVVLVVEYLGGLVTHNSMWLNQWFGLWNLGASAFCGKYSFHLWQPFTYMFLHSGFWHLFCNMFAVLMFGPAIERQWGSRKYLIFYLVCGVGAALVQELVWMYTNGTYPGVTVGASGAVFGILLAFGWLFPEVKMFLLFIPIPIPSRIFVGLYALLELFQGVSHSAGDNVAHFAHLGGMLFGALLILYWKKKGTLFYDDATYRPSLWSKIKHWFADRKQSHERHSDTDFSGYHYQAPIREDKPQTNLRDEEVNRLLDKIKREGYDALTQEEKDRLFKRDK